MDKFVGHMKTDEFKLISSDDQEPTNFLSIISSAAFCPTNFLMFPIVGEVARTDIAQKNYVVYLDKNERANFSSRRGVRGFDS